MSTEEKNVLIAEFMGATIDEDGNVNFIEPADGIGLVGIGKHAMRYDNSWDWLMPVVEKIQSIDITPPPNYTGYKIEIVVQGYVKITGFPMPPISTNVSIEGSLINAVYKAVVQFIQWYNQNKNK